MTKEESFSVKVREFQKPMAVATNFEMHHTKLGDIVWHRHYQNERYKTN